MWEAISDLYDDLATVGKTNALLNAAGKTIQIKKLELAAAGRLVGQPAKAFLLPGVEK